MKKNKTVGWIVCGLLLAGSLVARADGEKRGYPALENATSYDVIYDLRSGNPMQVELFLRLIHEGFIDPSVRQVTDTPRAVIVINGYTVRLIGESATTYTEDERALIKDIEARIKAMTKDGIRVEACLMAAAIFNVDATTFPPEAIPVENAWISLVGYQGKGYSLIPVY